MNKIITVKLELDSPYELTAEEIEKDLRMAEDQIGWNYDYAIRSVEVISNLYAKEENDGRSSDKRDAFDSDVQNSRMDR